MLRFSVLTYTANLILRGFCLFLVIRVVERAYTAILSHLAILGACAVWHCLLHSSTVSTTWLNE